MNFQHKDTFSSRYTATLLKMGSYSSTRMCQYWDIHKDVSILGYSLNLLSSLLTILLTCPNSDTLLCYSNEPFLTVKVMSHHREKYTCHLVSHARPQLPSCQSLSVSGGGEYNIVSGRYWGQVYSSQGRLYCAVLAYQKPTFIASTAS